MGSEIGFVVFERNMAEVRVIEYELAVELVSDTLGNVVTEQLVTAGLNGEAKTFILVGRGGRSETTVGKEAVTGDIAVSVGSSMRPNGDGESF